MKGLVVAGLVVMALVVPPLTVWGQDRLPLHEIPADSGRTLALFLSGDGGWVGIDRDVSRSLAGHGVAVVGLDVRSYLGARRTPEQVALDAGQVLQSYLQRWHRDRVLLVGYSRGADIVPFIANRLPNDLRNRIDLIAMLGLGEHAGFHFGLFDLLHTTTNRKDPPVAPELEALGEKHVPMLCVYGANEKESLCRDLALASVQRVERQGAHHFDGDHRALAGDILAALRPAQ